MHLTLKSLCTLGSAHAISILETSPWNLENNDNWVQITLHGTNICQQMHVCLPVLFFVLIYSPYTLTALGHRVCLENAWHSLRITLFLQPSPSSSLLILQELAHMPPTLPTQVKMKLSLLWASTRVFHLCRLWLRLVNVTVYMSGSNEKVRFLRTGTLTLVIPSTMHNACHESALGKGLLSDDLHCEWTTIGTSICWGLTVCLDLG